MRILMVGDVVGRPGRRAVKQVLPGLRSELGLDFVVVNAENAAGGFGLTADTADELLAAGADVLTGGNHTFDKQEVIPLMDGELPILRPANYPPATPGRGHLRVGPVAVINLQGRVFMPEGLDSPFAVADAILDEVADSAPKAILIDFHTEATSEQAALAWRLDGRVSAVVGTHTHVPTADARVLPLGTAFVTDLGMTGPRDSIIGSKIDDVLYRFLTAMPRRLNIEERRGPAQFNALFIETDDLTGLAKRVERVDRIVDA